VAQRRAIVAVRRAGERQRVLEHAFLAEVLSPQHERAGPVALVPTQHVELVPAEEVRQRPRVEVAHAAGWDFDPDVGEDGGVDPVVEARERDFQVISATHVLREAGRVPRDAVEKLGIEVLPDAEHEHALPLDVSVSQYAEQLDGRGGADRGLAIRKKHHELQAIAARRIGQGETEPLFEVGAAPSLQLVDVGLRHRAVLIGGRGELPAELSGLRREVHDVESVPGIEAGDAVPQGFLDLLELGPQHAAGRVDRENDVFGRHGRGSLGPRSDRQEEEAVGLATAMRDEDGREGILAHVPAEDEVLVGAQRLRLERNSCLPFPSPGHERGLVGWTVNGSNRRRRAEADVHDDVGIIAAGVFAGVERIAVSRRPAIPSQRLRVLERDVDAPAARDGEDAGAEKPAFNVLEEPRVPRATDDVLVKPAGFVFLENLSRDLAPAHLEREVRYRGVGRQREHVNAFERSVVGVLERLLDTRPGRGLIDVNTDAMARDAEREVRSRPPGRRRTDRRRRHDADDDAVRDVDEAVAESDRWQACREENECGSRTRKPSATWGHGVASGGLSAAGDTPRRRTRYALSDRVPAGKFPHLQADVPGGQARPAQARITTSVPYGTKS
jgi:hypothetical protein